MKEINMNLIESIMYKIGAYKFSSNRTAEDVAADIIEDLILRLQSIRDTNNTYPFSKEQRDTIDKVMELLFKE